MNTFWLTRKSNKSPSTEPTLREGRQEVMEGAKDEQPAGSFSPATQPLSLDLRQLAGNSLCTMSWMDAPPPASIQECRKEPTTEYRGVHPNSSEVRGLKSFLGLHDPTPTSSQRHWLGLFPLHLPPRL